MIISASRRTDIPACFSPWLCRRIREEYVLVRNPMNFHQISRISLSPSVVEGIVFWTKNPLPFMEHLTEFEKYNYYFQFTLTPYGWDIESGLPPKSEILIPVFEKLSKQIGRKRIVWRYDPILLNEKYTVDFHLKSFQEFASRLGEFTETCTISFLDLYRSISKKIKERNIRTPDFQEQTEIAGQFAKTAKTYGFTVNTCAEEGDFASLGVKHGCCIDKDRLEEIGNISIKGKKDPYQRKECRCVASVDIGAYNTCENGCVYCYANRSKIAVKKNNQLHDPDSPLLFGHVEPEDTIKEREE